MAMINTPRSVRRLMRRRQSAVRLGSFETRELDDETKNSILADYNSSKRVSMFVGISTHMNLARMHRSGVAAEDQTTTIHQFVETLRRELGRTPRVYFINATEQGGGVAEMRPDTTMLLRDVGVSADWLVIDGCAAFYKATVHLHEGVQNPEYPPLTQPEIETIQMICCQNVMRMEKEHLLEKVDIMWIDDPQPLSMIPLIRILHPTVSIVWRCHIHADPEKSIKNYIRDMAFGKMTDQRDYVLRSFLLGYGVDQKRLDECVSAYESSADVAVFHMPEFASGLQMGSNCADCPLDVFTMPPAINPLAFKNMTVSEDFMVATLKKYGVMGKDETEIPPIVLEVSRFDPYKGPLEVITSFVEMVKMLPEEDRRQARFIFAASLPGDNPTGRAIASHCRSFVETFPELNLGPGLEDITSRIFLLELQDKTSAELLVARIAHLGRMERDRTDMVLQQCLELHSRQSLEKVLSSLVDVGFVDEPLADQVYKERDGLVCMECGVRFTKDQLEASLTTMETAKRTLSTQRRARLNVLLGKEINHLEVNAMQTAARVICQFSSKEGFGLVVAEGMIKYWEKIPKVMVATEVGGVCVQIAGGALGVEYQQEDIVQSLRLYQKLKDCDKYSCSKMYAEIASRRTVQEFAHAMKEAYMMPKEKRDEVNRKSRRYVLEHFSTTTNVMNILKAMQLSCSTTGDILV